MNYFVNVTTAAKRDLAELFDYIDLTLKNPTAADTFVDTAAEKLHSLDTFPTRCALVNDRMLSDLGIRFLPFQSYLAFFLVDESHTTVHILRVLYGKSDWASILKKDLLHS